MQNCREEMQKSLYNSPFLILNSQFQNPRRVEIAGVSPEGWTSAENSTRDLDFGDDLL